jgi:hypothetical protein
MSLYLFRLYISNLQTVRASITKPDDAEFKEKTPKGKLRFTKNKTKILALVDKACHSPNSDGAITQTEIKELGTLLFNVLFEGAVRDRFWEYYDNVKEENQKQPGSAVLSIELLFDEEVKGVPLLASLPWEFLYAVDREKDDPWVAYAPSIRFTRGRQMDHRLSSAILYPGKPLQIALAVAEFDQKILEKSHLGPVDAQSLRSTLRKLNDTSDAGVKFIDLNEEMAQDEVLDFKTLDRLLQKYKPDIFHFIGHGRFIKDGKKSTGEIALVDAFKQPAWIGEDEFCDLFGTYQPPVVLLQSCQGGAKSPIYAERGVGPSILRKQIRLVIAMQYEISNNTANTFSKVFYEHFVAKRSIKDAVQEGRHRILTELLSFDTREFATPVLFTNPCEYDDPFYIDPDLFELWQILVESQIMDEKLADLFASLTVDMGRINGIDVSGSQNLPDWIATLSKVKEQRWNIKANIWDTSSTEKSDLHPLIWLVEHIAKRTSKETSEKLRVWNDRNQQKFKITPDALKSLRQNLDKSGGKLIEPHSLLLVAISQPETDEKCYLIHADYYRNGAWRSLKDVDTSASKDTLESKLEEFFGRLVEEKLSSHRTSIGFVVDGSLLSFPFETVSNGSGEDPIGKIFPVFIKLQGRDKIPYSAYMKEWLETWDLVKECDQTRAYDVMREFDEKLLDSPINSKDLPGTRLAVLRCFPSRDFAKRPEKWPRILYEHGTSIALWLRDGKNIDEINMQDYRKNLQDFLLEYHLRYLPEKLKLMRKISSGFDKEVGNYLVLLWDDPEQLPNYDKQASVG